MPANTSILPKPHLTLLDTARQARVAIRSRCDGKAGCLMCKVVVEGEDRLLHPPTEAERRKLGTVQKTGTRLACQVRLTGEAGTVNVHVPEDPLKAAIRRQLEQQNDDQLW
ncbi:(2Fe-2S)-binding protein [Paenibacillus sp. 481]|nr:2Fe-2S iron-sulfur cluster-binding protein [Paenibacillus sp. 481]UHA76221.1 (2Fe-2S)-binding protein [Paenibacillus sp. 481]